MDNEEGKQAGEQGSDGQGSGGQNSDRQSTIEEAERIAQALNSEEELFKELLGPLYVNGGEIHINKCPVCGSDQRVFEILYDYLVKCGKAKPQSFACSSSNTQAFASAAGGALIGSLVPSITILRDICRKCGNEYPVRVIRQDMTLGQVQPHVPPLNSQRPGH